MAEWAPRAADSSAVLRAMGRAGEAGGMVAPSVRCRPVIISPLLSSAAMGRMVQSTGP
jgi:hypothetical protein